MNRGNGGEEERAREDEQRGLESREGTEYNGRTTRLGEGGFTDEIGRV